MDSEQNVNNNEKEIHLLKVNRSLKLLHRKLPILQEDKNLLPLKASQKINQFEKCLNF